MGYKNRKSDYPLYPTIYFEDVRDMLTKTAEKYGERTAISYRVKPKDEKSVKLSFEKVANDVRSLATSLIAKVYLSFIIFLL